LVVSDEVDRERVGTFVGPDFSAGRGFVVRVTRAQLKYSLGVIQGYVLRADRLLAGPTREEVGSDPLELHTKDLL